MTVLDATSRIAALSAHPPRGDLMWMRWVPPIGSTPLTIVVTGEIDQSNYVLFADVVIDAVATHSRFVLDLGAVGFLGASALRLVEAAVEELQRSGGRLAVVAGADVARMMRILGIARTFGCSSTWDGACRALRAD